MEDYLFCVLANFVEYMARKGPEVGKGMLDFVEDLFVGVKSHIKSPNISNPNVSCCFPKKMRRRMILS